MNQKQPDMGFHAYIRGIILIGFSLLMLSFIITGTITYYIAPTMLPFVYFATAVFLILGVLQIVRSTAKGQEEELLCDCGTDHSVQGSLIVKLLIYGIFVTPIVLGFVLPDKLLDSSVAANRGIQYGSGLNESTQASPATTDTSRAQAFLDDPDAYYAELENGSNTETTVSSEEFYTEEGYNQYYEELIDTLLAEEQITVTEENYLDVMTVLDLHLDRFIGKSIMISGFVYREQDLAENKFVVARFGMTCCVADASVYGTMVQTEEASQLENDTWIEVQGIVTETTYNDMRIPLIDLREFEQIEQPDTPYVYPRFSF